MIAGFVQLYAIVCRKSSAFFHKMQPLCHKCAIFLAQITQARKTLIGYEGQVALNGCQSGVGVMLAVKTFVRAILVVTAGCAGLPSWGQTTSTQGVLVELFTSQGCSSCPPADAVLQQLTQVDGVIPLSLHVDYWDYIGWSDTFAQEKFSKRQRRYAAAVSDRMVYTPQMIVAGDARVKGYDSGEVRAEIAAARALVDLQLVRQGDDVVISAQPKTAMLGEFVVDIVRYRPQSVVSIARGENQGQQIAYHNIVTEWENLGQWSGQEALSLRARATGPAPVVVIIQRKGPRDVVAAAVLK